MAIGFYRLTKPPKTGPLVTEYETWFRMRDAIIKRFPGLYVGIVGKQILAAATTHDAVYSEIVSRKGNVAMCIEEANYSRYPNFACTSDSKRKIHARRSMFRLLKELADQLERGIPPVSSPRDDDERAARIRQALFLYRRRKRKELLLEVLQEEAKNFEGQPWYVAAPYLFHYWMWCLEVEEVEQQVVYVPRSFASLVMAQMRPLGEAPEESLSLVGNPKMP